MKRGLILLAALATFSSANALVLIDDFTTGPYGVSLLSGSDLAFQTASVPGGERGTFLAVESNPLSQWIDLAVGNGFGIVSSGTLADALAQTAYGYTSDGAGGFLLADLNLDLSGESAFRVVFEANDLPMTMRIYVNPLSGGSMVSTVVAGGIFSTTVVEVPFASFTSVNFADIDQLVFEFDSGPSGDFAISSITAVPEPTTLVGLGLASLAFVRRRRG